MKTVWMVSLIVSSLLLFVVMFRNKLPLQWVRRFALHLIAAALVLYVLNFSGLISGMEVPLNPMTIGTVVLLGLPGIMLVLGLQMTLF
ncbi:pro-sigmaK processing inhibitor BofA family protein [Paenibacillus sp. OV219]|uniref:pro-sigmaK processing inhibitor BofA family protein n=1 Tax=Paenibacillus sp. OV219 TaxID=1884377 RepID=UPI0008C0B465|nr:pro-sigmaK processing inhibitor BofA family protein [Paenibacillus sp. OV219]SEO85181.1 inhibitor of the pro-sigma K processing machinery [Paenibacillus sp. OV219]